MRPVRVVLVDDHAVMRLGIRNLLSRSTDIQVIGEASNGLEALEAVENLHPDVLMLDMEMPIMDGVEVARRMRAADSPTKILAFSAYNDKFYVQSLLDMGASGYLTKDEDPSTIIEAVLRVADGEKGWLTHKAASRLDKS
jgi:DNA-binding NarL/FixJ family response regulator